MAPRKSGGELTPRQERFINEYLLDDNASRAYLAAGYASSTPAAIAVNASQLLHSDKVQRALADRRRAISEALEITQERIAREYARIAFADLRDLVEWGPEGVNLRPSSELTDDQAAAVSEVSETRGRNPSRRLKLHSKTEALDALARQLGMYPDKREISLNLTVMQVDQALRALLEADRRLAAGEIELTGGEYQVGDASGGR